MFGYCCDNGVVDMRHIFSCRRKDDYKVIIYDEKMMIDGLRVYLRGKGFGYIKGTTNSKKLLEMIKNENFDILIIDYMLDKINASVLISEIKRISPDLSIILLINYKDVCEPLETIANLNVEEVCEKSLDYTTIMVKILRIKNRKMRNRHLDTSFGRKLAYSRKTQKVSQDQLAEVLSVTRETISSYERDLTKPEIDKVVQISKYLGIDLNWLL